MADTRKRSAGKKTKNVSRGSGMSDEQTDEIISIILIALAIFVFLCNFKILGAVGNAISGFMFGMFGLPAYIIPIVVGVISFFKLNKNLEDIPGVKIFGTALALLMIAVICELISNAPVKDEAYSAKEIWEFAKENHKGGGILGGSTAYLLNRLLDKTGTILIDIVVLIICFVLITGKSFLGSVVSATTRTYDTANDYRRRAKDRYDANEPERRRRRSESERRRSERRQESERRREENEKRREERAEERRLREQALEDEKTIKHVSGVTTYNFISEEETKEAESTRDDIHEIKLLDEDIESIKEDEIVIHSEGSYHDTDSDELNELTSFEDTDDIIIPGRMDGTKDVAGALPAADKNDTGVSLTKSGESIFAKEGAEHTNGGRTFGTQSGTAKEAAPKSAEIKKPQKDRPYEFPSTKLLNEIPASSYANEIELKETAKKLEEVLASFNISAKVTDVSRGPAVTRFEMVPETGVKVSRIIGLTDDIKLNLAATDIRIEAPIPGKSAIGIEVPNKVSSAVVLRELLESKEYKAANSKISFAVGKDLTGKIIVSDIAKMPHMLIAGGTGSGKSVCINTLIMSILYKATPDEVKLIMIDPKVVELSVYNGIPHLLIPVVTDPKKASAALQWAVSEMNERYQRFADYGVRNLSGYNEAIKNETDENGEKLPPMYQLVVIVDEMADLMMVAGKEVEEAICRLAQLARAAGIHLILATQRPSVDVITGLIKANMPSRVAFAVSSGTDSRTILDMNGAEKLLGKGDMLFYPQGYTKPARVQGAFVDDNEVAHVVEFLKGRSEHSYSDDILSKINSSSIAQGAQSGAGGALPGSDDGQDEYFADAARLIVENNKASIGLLQRKFKIGFNRAARIMDALAEAGVVGPDEGTKPRAVLVTPEELENIL